MWAYLKGVYQITWIRNGFLAGLKFCSHFEEVGTVHILMMVSCCNCFFLNEGTCLPTTCAPSLINVLMAAALKEWLWIGYDNVS